MAYQYSILISYGSILQNLEAIVYLILSMKFLYVPCFQNKLHF